MLNRFLILRFTRNGDLAYVFSRMIIFLNYLKYLKDKEGIFAIFYDVDNKNLNENKSTNYTNNISFG